MLHNCFIDFDFDYQFGCRATEPGFAGKVGAIEIWLIDQLMEKLEWIGMPAVGAPASPLFPR